MVAQRHARELLVEPLERGTELDNARIVRPKAALGRGKGLARETAEFLEPDRPFVFKPLRRDGGHTPLAEARESVLRAPGRPADGARDVPEKATLLRPIARRIVVPGVAGVLGHAFS